MLGRAFIALVLNRAFLALDSIIGYFGPNPYIKELITPITEIDGNWFLKCLFPIARIHFGD
jgi:hypothetical protein